jgi:hypothetical protein
LEEFWTRAAASGVSVHTDVDRSFWDDHIGELRERSAVARLRRASGKTGERSNFEGERSNVEGERSNFEGDRGKSSRAGAASAVSPARSCDALDNSARERSKSEGAGSIS